MILQKCEKKYIATLASHKICDYSGRNKAYRGYLATEFIFSLIIFSITIYIFSFFIVNVTYMEKKLVVKQVLHLQPLEMFKKQAEM